MERRELLKIVALTALTRPLNALPGHMMEGMQAPLPTPAYTRKFFTEEESQFLDQVMELIIPADEHSPGAHAAQTNLFADLMVGIGPENVQQKWREGIRLMQQEAKKSSLDDALHKASLHEESPETELERFYLMLKQTTVDGYYTSTIGIHQEMGYVGNAYLGAFPGCSHPEHSET